MTWRVEVCLTEGTENYAKELLEVLETYTDVTNKPEVFPASRIVVLDQIPKDTARTVVEWTMEFWSAANKIEVRENSES